MRLIYKLFIVSILFIASFPIYALSQSSAEMYYALGQKYMEQGKFSLAVLSLKKAVELSPDWAEAHNSLGMAYYQLFEFDNAIEQFDKAIELNPYYTEAKINKNRTLRSIDRYKPVKDTRLKLWHKFAIVSGILTVVAVTALLVTD